MAKSMDSLLLLPAGEMNEMQSMALSAVVDNAH